MNDPRYSEPNETQLPPCRSQLLAAGQLHLLRWWDELDDTRRARLLADIESVPWNSLGPLMDTHVLNRPGAHRPGKLEPAPTYPSNPRPGEQGLYQRAAQRGEALLRAGKVAAFTVAGGQGTRLGGSVPKGTVQVSPVKNKSLFQLFAETILAVRQRYSAPIPWYIMTSLENHQETLDYFQGHEFFGLPQGDVLLFAQGMLPLFDLNGQVLMKDKHRLCLGPDGHGGSLKSLAAGGALEDMKRRGIDLFSYFHVDNPLIQPFDLRFIGLHALKQSEMSIKVTPKADDLERVGNVCLEDGQVVVIEYMNLPDELARARNDDGSRRFDAANLGIHLFNLAFVQRIVSDSFELPYHRAEKAVDFIDRNGLAHKPNQPNAVKLELFVFDALPLARKTLVWEVDRDEEFSPVKNASGSDSMETAQRDQVRRAARWLEAAGISVPRNAEGEPACKIEIAPSFALSPQDVISRVVDIPDLAPGDGVYLD